MLQLHDEAHPVCLSAGHIFIGGAGRLTDHEEDVGDPRVANTIKLVGV